MTHEESFQELKKFYIEDAEAYIKALRGLSLDDYTGINILQTMATLRNRSVNSSIILSDFVVKEVTDKRKMEISAFAALQ